MLDFADGGVNPAWQHPIHWAPFVLVGDGRPLDLLSTQARQ
jgi:CHAT domain-containing protein